jgi:F-type H+-transporting ATPase subunit b
MPAQEIATTVATAAAAHPDILGSLGINWKLFLAQLVNFGIVLFVLWKWAFTPLQNALEKRRKTVETGLEDAKAAAAARANAERDADTTVGTARREAQCIIDEARTNAEKLRLESKTTAQAEVAAVVAEGRTVLAQEKEKMVHEAKADIADLAVATAAKALGVTLDEKSQRAALDAAVKRVLAS